MKRPFGLLDLFRNQIVQVSDIFQGWNIGHIKLLCLQNVANHPRMKFNFCGHTYVCDCMDYWLYKFIKSIPRTEILDGVRCAGQHLAISVPLTEFICDLADRCPSSCQCVYRPENTTLHIYYSAANLSSLPLRQVQTGFLEQQTTSTSGTSSVLRQHLNLGRQ